MRCRRGHPGALFPQLASFAADEFWYCLYQDKSHDREWDKPWEFVPMALIPPTGNFCLSLRWTLQRQWMYSAACSFCVFTRPKGFLNPSCRISRPGSIRDFPHMPARRSMRQKALLSNRKPASCRSLQLLAIIPKRRQISGCWSGRPADRPKNRHGRDWMGIEQPLFQTDAHPISDMPVFHCKSVSLLISPAFLLSLRIEMLINLIWGEADRPAGLRCRHGSSAADRDFGKLYSGAPRRSHRSGHCAAYHASKGCSYLSR